MRIIKPKRAYFFALTKVRDVTPISEKFGFDRGTPIDRYYIEKFVEEHKELIKGHCVEIHDDAYIKRFGENKVTQSDALDVDESNKQATIIADLRHMPHVPSDTYDCIVLTQTLGMIDDFESAVRECHRILKPGGWIIVTCTATGPALYPEVSFWRFTEASLKFTFKKLFKPESIKSKTYGNALVAQYMITGLAQEELSREELEYEDVRFPVIVGLIAQK